MNIQTDPDSMTLDSCIARETTLAVDAVLFDLDGTLVDSVADLYIGVCGMLRDMGRPELPVESVRAYVGRGMHNLVKRALADSLEASEDPSPAPQDAVDSFRRHYAEANGKHATCYPGVFEGLAMLKDKGIPMAVITNKPDAFTLPLIEQLGLGGFFDVVVGGDRFPRQKPDPMPLIWTCGRLNVAPRHTVFVGDSVNDFLAGRAADCHVYLLPYGYNEGRDVRELACDAIVPTVASAAQRIIKRPS